MQRSEHSDDNEDFAKTVDEIKRSEAEADSIQADAKTKAEQILRKGKEAVLKIKSETEEAIIKAKDEELQAGRDEIEQEVQETTAKAHKDGEKLSKKRLTGDAAFTLLKQFIFE